MQAARLQRGSTENLLGLFRLIRTDTLRRVRGTGNLVQKSLWSGEIFIS